MKIKSVLLLAGLGIMGQALAEAPRNPVSVHVLNTQTGKPSAGIKVDLEQQQGGKWIALASKTTDKDGRIGAFYPEGKAFTAGEYRVTFHTGDYFQQQQQATFFPDIPVNFQVTSTQEHYHIPLLLSQYGFSTYRGS